MAFLTDTEKAALAEQIKQAESRTTGEIVTVIAQQSDSYRYIPLLWAALGALSLPGWYFLYTTLVHKGWVHPEDNLLSATDLYTMQVLVFLGLGMLFQWEKLQMLLIPKSVKQARAKRHAHEQFFLQNLHLTQHRTGLLIFVSVAEHYVEIIVDKGIAESVNNDVWVETVNDFITQVQQGNINAGFSNTVEHCKDILWEHFPAELGSPEELPNHLIEV